MPRKARLISPTQVYHVMLRGIDRRNIFMEDDDFLSFLQCLKIAQAKDSLEIMAFCLMDNHVHLIVKEEDYGMLSISMHRIANAYAKYHNHKYERCGHLFENRFKSQVIDTDRYFLRALRYVHRNPILASMVTSVGAYPWSSHQDYLRAYSAMGGCATSNKPPLIDTNRLMSRLPQLESYLNLMNTDDEDDVEGASQHPQLFEDRKKDAITDSALHKVLTEAYDLDNFHLLNFKDRNDSILTIYKNYNTSTRQLARILQMTRSMIHRAVNVKE